VAIFVNRNCSNLHLSSNNNLALVNNIRDALAKIDSVCLALVTCKKLFKAGKPVPNLSIEEVFNSFKKDDSDKES
jgi:hypothetical protein